LTGARLPLGALVLCGEHGLLGHVATRHRDGTATVCYYGLTGGPTFAKGRWTWETLAPVAVRWCNAAENLAPGTSYVTGETYSTKQAALEAALPFHRYALPCYLPPGRSAVILHAGAGR